MGYRLRRCLIGIGGLILLSQVVAFAYASRMAQRELHEPSDIQFGDVHFLVGAGYTRAGHTTDIGKRYSSLLFEAVLPDLKPVAFATRAEEAARWFYRDQTVLVLLQYKGPSFAEGDIPPLFTRAGSLPSSAERLSGYYDPVMVAPAQDLYVRREPSTEPAYVMCPRRNAANPEGRNRCRTIDAIDPKRFPQGADGRYGLTMSYFFPRQHLQNIQEIDRSLRRLVTQWEAGGRKVPGH